MYDFVDKKISIYNQAKKEDREYTEDERETFSQYTGDMFPDDKELTSVKHLLDYIKKEIKVVDPTDYFAEDYGNREIKLEALRL